MNVYAPEKWLDDFCKLVVLVIRKNISDGVFKLQEFGRPLAPSTLARRIKRGIKREQPLWCEGLFKRGLVGRVVSKTAAYVYSTGRDEDEQASFITGNPSKNIPPRNAFNKAQPGIRAKTLEDEAIAKFATHVFLWANAEIRDNVKRLNAKTRR